jgi:hypothetical protein
VLHIDAVDKTIRKYSNLEEMKADEIREWQQLSAAERMEAVREITLAAYRIKGLITDVPRLERTLVRLQQPESQYPSEDLIAAKLAAGRPQDIADVAALRKAAEDKK